MLGSIASGRRRVVRLALDPSGCQPERKSDSIVKTYLPEMI